MKDFNPDEYRADIAELALTPEQENELLAVLWSIMWGFVDIGFGVDSIQLCFTEASQFSSEIEPDELGFSSSRTIEKGNDAAHFAPPELGDS